METHIYDEKNGLSYTLHGDYYLPDLVLNEEEREKFRKEYLDRRGIPENFRW